MMKRLKGTGAQRRRGSVADGRLIIENKFNMSKL
jgi:hypothetical protein